MEDYQEEGYKEIKEVKEGEKVESFNEDTGEKKLKKVTGVEITEAQKLIHIKTERAEIKVTPSHPMLKIGNTWVFAGALRVGDKLAGYGGDEVEVTEIEEEILGSPEKVYNLTIEDFHTYVVSEESVVVHNKCDLPGLKSISKVDINVKPEVTHGKFQNIINDLYKGQGGANTIGNGTTMDAVRNEIMTGNPTNGKFHTSKLNDYVNALKKRLRAGDLTQYEESVAKAILEDAINALSGN